MVDVLKIVRDRIKKKYSKEETKSSEEVWTCPLCRLNFDSEETFKKHRRQYHQY